MTTSPPTPTPTSSATSASSTRTRNAAPICQKCGRQYDPSTGPGPLLWCHAC